MHGAQARYHARRALQTKLRSRELGRQVAQAIWQRCGKRHTVFMAEMRGMVKAVHYAAAFKRSVRGVLELPAKHAAMRAARHTNEPFIVTDSKQEQARQAMAMEAGRTGKGGFVAH